jgi:hypothetical protein
MAPCFGGPKSDDYKVVLDAFWAFALEVPSYYIYNYDLYDDDDDDI